MSINLYHIKVLQHAWESLKYEPKDHITLNHLNCICSEHAPGDYKFVCWKYPHDTSFNTGLIAQVEWCDMESATAWCLLHT